MDRDRPPGPLGQAAQPALPPLALQLAVQPVVQLVVQPLVQPAASPVVQPVVQVAVQPAIPPAIRGLPDHPAQGRRALLNSIAAAGNPPVQSLSFSSSASPAVLHPQAARHPSSGSNLSSSSAPDAPHTTFAALAAASSSVAPPSSTPVSLSPSQVIRLAKSSVRSAHDDNESQAIDTSAEYPPGVTIDWSCQGIESLPDEVVDIIKDRLERLALSNNQISTLPARFSDLTSLRYLNVRFNQIKEFPLPLCRLKSLEILDLGGNQLQVLPEDIVKLSSLKVLSLRENRIIRLPLCLADMASLQRLKLEGNDTLIFPPREVLQELSATTVGDGVTTREATVAEKERVLTARIKQYMRRCLLDRAAEANATANDLLEGSEPPRPSIKRVTSGRFPVKVEGASLPGLRSPSLPRPPPIPTRSHYRGLSQQSTSTLRRPGVLPLTIGTLSERLRSNSETVVPTRSSITDSRSRRNGMVSRKASELSTLDETQVNNRFSHFRGFSHGSALQSGNGVSTAATNPPESGSAMGPTSSPGSVSYLSGKNAEHVSEPFLHRSVYIRRLSILPEQRHSPKVYDPVIEAAKGILHSVFQIHPIIQMLVSLASDEGGKRSSLEIVFYNTNSHVVELEQELQKHDPAGTTAITAIATSAAATFSSSSSSPASSFSSASSSISSSFSPPKHSSNNNLDYNNNDDINRSRSLRPLPHSTGNRSVDQAKPNSDAPANTENEGVFRACQTLVSAYTHVCTLLASYIDAFVDKGDPRYLRTLLTLLYNSIMELRVTLSNMEADGPELTSPPPDSMTSTGSTLRPVRPHEKVVTGASFAMRSRSSPLNHIRNGLHVITNSEVVSFSSAVHGDGIEENGSSNTIATIHGIESPVRGVFSPDTDGGSVRMERNKGSGWTAPLASVTPRSTEYFESTIVNGQGPDSTGSFSDEDRQFERVFLSLQQSSEMMMRTLPSFNDQISGLLRSQMAQRVPDRMAAQRLQAVIAQCSGTVRNTEALKQQMSLIKLKEPGLRGRTAFWQATCRFVVSWIEAGVMIKEVSDRKLRLPLPQDLKFRLRPVQKAVKETISVILQSPWHQPLRQALNPREGAERGRTTIHHLQTPLRLLPPPPMTPRNGPHGITAHAIVPSTPRSATFATSFASSSSIADFDSGEAHMAMYRPPGSSITTDPVAF